MYKDWQLNDLFPQHPPMAGASLGGGAFDQFAVETIKMVRVFHKTHRGKLGKYNPGQLLAFMEQFDQLECRLARIGAYCYLRYATQMNDPQYAKFYNDSLEILSQCNELLIFVGLAMNKLPENILHDAQLQKYHYYFAVLRKNRPHQLPESVEVLLNDLSLSSSDALIRIYDETHSKLRYPLDGKDLTQAEILNYFYSTDPDMRFKAAKSLGFVLKQHEYLFAIIYNAIIQGGHTINNRRKFATPDAPRHLDNEIAPQIVENLRQNVQDSIPAISHQYYQTKAKLMGKAFLPYWDRLAPVFPDNDRQYTIAQACDIVLKAYHDFSPQMADIARQFINNGWIDWLPGDGKASGAFSHPCSVDTHPYILLNFQGKLDDIMTLAHELGHGVHQYLCRAQGQILSDTPLVLAETASIFGEMLVFDYMMQDNQLSRAEKIALTTQKCEDGINTVIRQMAFDNFEQRAHAMRKNGVLTPENIGQLWRTISVDSLGSAVHFDSDFDSYWCYISHFFHTPFYVYSYSFGDLLTRAIYAQYKQNPVGFADKYVQFLGMGGCQAPHILLQNLGCDIHDNQFWQLGLQSMRQMVDTITEYANGGRHG